MDAYRMLIDNGGVVHIHIETCVDRSDSYHAEQSNSSANENDNYYEYFYN